MPLSVAQKMLVMQRPRAATVAAFTPTDVTGLQAWYDASVASSITGSPVSQWNDLSGNARHLTAALLARPATGGTLNGKNVLTFDGSANILQAVGLTTPAVNTGTWIIAFKPTATTAYERVFSLSTAQDTDFNNAARIAAIIRYGDTLAYVSFYNGDTYGASVAVTNAAHVVVTQRNGDVFSCWCDGAAGTGGTGLGTANFGFTSISVGANAAVSDFWKGDVAEVLWYSTAISAGNRQSIEAYLKTKWATP